MSMRMTDFLDEKEMYLKYFPKEQSVLLTLESPLLSSAR